LDVETLVKADQKNVFVSMASIVAKVERDWVMLKMAKKYPEYWFEKHKGYGTKLHRNMIQKYGACKIHRKLFLRNILG
jgi:ribonuclease HII